MDKAQAQQFRHRWRAVEEIQKREARTATLELRWRQLNAAYSLSMSLKLVSDQPDETRGYERWARLKEKAGRVNKA
ncbi:MAG: hypothetical protein WC674_05065 [Candidatus Krumholzibacteriia bacterium]